MRTGLRNKAAPMPIFLWAAVGLLLLMIGRALAEKPWEVSTLLLVFFVFVFLLNKRVEYAITLLILFSIGVFGIYRGLSMPHITVPFGRFYISDVLLLALAAHAFWRKISRRGAVRYKKSGLVWAVSFLFGAIMFEASVNLLSGLNIRSLFFGLRLVAYYAVFFIVLYEIEKAEQLKKLLISLLAVALITSFISYFQFFSGHSFAASKIEVYQRYDILRTYQCGQALINACFLVLISMALSGVPKKMSALSWTAFSILTLGGAILTSFARSIWGSVLLGALLVIILSKKRALVTHGILLVLVFVLLMFAADKALKSVGDEGVRVLQHRLISGPIEFESQSGTYLNRLNLIRYKWSAMSNANLIYGRGFDWGPKGMNWNLNPYHPIADSSIPNIFIIFGIPGFLIFGGIFFALFWRGLKLLNKMPVSLYKSVVLGILAFNLQILAVCFFGNRISWVPSVAILGMSWGVLEVLGRFHEVRKYVA